MKKQFLLVFLAIAAVGAYFVVPAKKDTKPASPVNMASLEDLKQVTNKPASPKINPPHGQPGHRCDVKAGAPLPVTVKSPVFNKPMLNPPSGFTSTPAAASGNPVHPISGTNSEKSVPSGTTSKINPPHGEPGHRCEIKTGDPLPAPGSNPVVKPAAPKGMNLPQVPASANAKLNPAHGAAGHRCDIQVGAPLPAS